MTTSIDDRVVDESDDPIEVTETGCVVVGGGPAGAMLALLLARAGVEVVLLEAHGDFDRPFRGDTVHPATLEILDAIGLGPRVHQLPHTRVTGISLETPDGTVMAGDLQYLRSPFRYIMLVHQARFLEFLADEAARYPSFRLVMGANVRRLVHDHGRVGGVRYRQSDGWHEVRAAVVVAADGRNSKMRGLAGAAITRRDASIDSLWFTLPLLPDQPDRSFAWVNGAGLSGVM